MYVNMYVILKQGFLYKPCLSNPYNLRQAQIAEN